MKNWFKNNYRTLIIGAFLIPIVTVAIVSISHVTKWYAVSNPFMWAQYLSIGIEIAALSALAAISTNIGKKVYFPFIVVTLLQFIGNIYFTYAFIDIKSQSFLLWVELVSPLLSLFNIESTDLIAHKRFLSFLEGGILPIISLSFLHMLVVYTEDLKNIIINEQEELENDLIDNKINDNTEINTPKVNIQEIIEEPIIKETKNEYVGSPQRIRLDLKPIETLSDELLIENNTNIPQRENDAIKAGLARRIMARGRK